MPALQQCSKYVMGSASHPLRSIVFLASVSSICPHSDYCDSCLPSRQTSHFMFVNGAVLSFRR
eukprot:3856240-Rhodomonas_salina.1